MAPAEAALPGASDPSDPSDPSALSAPSAPSALRIEAVFCARAGSCDAVVLQLPAGVTVADALLASGLLARHGLLLDGLRTGVWGQATALHHTLRDRDRVEVYRPLLVDPKEARRQRYQKHKTTAAAVAPRAGG